MRILTKCRAKDPSTCRFHGLKSKSSSIKTWKPLPEPLPRFDQTGGVIAPVADDKVVDSKDEMDDLTRARMNYAVTAEIQGRSSL